MNSSTWWTGSAYVPWANTGGPTGTIADFRGTAGAVTIASGGVTVGADGNGAVTVNTSGYTLGGGALTYDGTGSGGDWIIYRMKAAGALTVNNDTVIKTYASAGNAFVKYAFANQ